VRAPALKNIANDIEDWIVKQKVGSSQHGSGIKLPANEEGRRRFDIVVFNYRKLDSFFTNFYKITNFNKDLDRITVVSCSPDASERKAVENYVRQGFQVRYLSRQNFGMAEYARLEYFSESSKYNDFAYSFTFHMQDHYLDTDSSFSKWGKELNFRVKGDVVPDDSCFDLNRLEQLFDENAIDCIFCDRNDPCYFEFAGGKFIAPNGANFIFRTAVLVDKKLQNLLGKLMLSCDNSYDWAVFMEFMFGVLFFPEGKLVFDLKRDLTFNDFDVNQFYLAPERFDVLFKKYTQGNQKRITNLKRLLHICAGKFHLT
jgi:hypothetical protein